MTNNTLLTIERKNVVLDRVGISRSNLHNKINDGLWVPPIRLGDRAVGFLVHETDQLLGAYILGRSKAQIRELVEQLIMVRSEKFNKKSNIEAAEEITAELNSFDFLGERPPQISVTNKLVSNPIGGGL